MHKSLLKLVFNTILCASLMLGAATFTACQDYDDDIKNLEGKVTALETAVNDLKTKINNGIWINNVTTNADGYTVTLSDGTTLNIVNGTKGTTIEPNKTTGTWWIDGKDTGIAYECEDVNMPKMDENGELLIWDAEKETYVSTGLKANSSFVVNKEKYWELHVAEKDAEGNFVEQVVKLPMSAAIADLKLYTIVAGTSNKLKDFDYATDVLNFFVAPEADKLAKDVTFNGKTYPKGNRLTVGDAASLLVKVNPINVDLTKYDVTLADSKGNAPFESKVVAHSTDNAYTKASVNPGYFKVSFTLPSDVKTVLNDTYAYAVKASDPASDNAVSSELIKVAVDETAASSTVEAGQTFTLKANKTYNVISNLLLDTDADGTADATFGEAYKLADFYFDLPQDQTANKEKYGITFNEATQEIYAEKAGEIKLRVNYLTLDGDKEEKVENTTSTAYKYVTVKFNSESTTGGDVKFPWTVAQENANTTVKESEVKIEVTEEYYNSFVNGTLAWEYTSEVTLNGATTPVVKKNSSGKLPSVTLASDDITFTPSTTNDANGYPHYYVTAKFKDPATATYYPTTYKGTLTTTATDPTTNATVTTNRTFEVVITLPEFSNLFQLKQGYWNGDKATIYANKPANATDNYSVRDITDLFVGLNANYYFTEKAPAHYKLSNTAKTPITPLPWLVTKGDDVKDADGNVLGYTGKAAVTVTSDKVNPVNITVPNYSYMLASASSATAGNLDYGFVQEGVNTERSFAAHYNIFNNPDQFGTFSKEFTLAVKSSWYDGAFTYVPATALVSATNEPVVITLADLLVVNAEGEDVVSPALIAKNEVLGASNLSVSIQKDSQLYLELANVEADIQSDKLVGWKKVAATNPMVTSFEVKKHTAAKEANNFYYGSAVGLGRIVLSTIQTEPINCKVDVTLLDPWNMKKVVTVDVVLNPVVPATPAE